MWWCGSLSCGKAKHLSGQPACLALFDMLLLCLIEKFLPKIWSGKPLLERFLQNDAGIRNIRCAAATRRVSQKQHSLLSGRCSGRQNHATRVHSKRCPASHQCCSRTSATRSPSPNPAPHWQICKPLSQNRLFSTRATAPFESHFEALQIRW